MRVTAQTDHEDLISVFAAANGAPVDPRPITEAVPYIIARQDAKAAHHLVAGRWNDRHVWLPEALTLFNTPKLGPVDKYRMLEKVFGLPMELELQTIESLADSSARFGRYGFSFPQWRYLSQSFDGACLLERFGMKRARRETDLRDASLPEPDKDLYGPGFVWHRSSWYVEYRRAYIVCANLSSNGTAIVIRNNAYYFGRDRLPAPVYVGFKHFTADELLNLNEAYLNQSQSFGSWNRLIDTQPRLELRHKASCVHFMLNFLDAFDARLSEWLFKGAGLNHLQAFIRHKQAASAPLPFAAIIDSRLPPWFPKKSVRLGEQSLDDIFAHAGGTTDKIVLLSGPNGDFPLKSQRYSPQMLQCLSAPVL